MAVFVVHYVHTHTAHTHTSHLVPHLSSRVETSRRRMESIRSIDDVKDDGWMDAIVRHSVRDDDEGGAGERERRCAVRRGVGAMPARAG